MKQATSQRGTGGRPPKFREPSGPITVTLPDSTLEKLRTIDGDRAKAIVKAVDALAGEGDSSPHAEVIEMAPGTGIVVVPYNRSLAKIPWLKMVEVAPMRYVLAITPGTPIEKVEVALIDLVEEAKLSAPEEVQMLETLRTKIGELRRGEKISMAEILFVSL